MSIYLLLALIGFILVFKMLFSVLGEKTLDNIPPILDENPPKNIHEPNYKEFFDEFETIKKNNSQEKSQKKQQDLRTINAHTTIKPNIEKHKQIEIKEENEFDLRKAIIYSEIINNPYLTKIKKW